MDHCLNATLNIIVPPGTYPNRLVLKSFYIDPTILSTLEAFCRVLANNTIIQHPIFIVNGQWLLTLSRNTGPVKLKYLNNNEVVFSLSLSIPEGIDLLSSIIKDVKAHYDSLR